jgi:hypothetical protein
MGSRRMPFWLKTHPPWGFLLPASLPPTLKEKGKISETFEHKVLNPELVRRARENLSETFELRSLNPELVE